MNLVTEALPVQEQLFLWSQTLATIIIKSATDVLFGSWHEVVLTEIGYFRKLYTGDKCKQPLPKTKKRTVSWRIKKLQDFSSFCFMLNYIGTSAHQELYHNVK